MRCLLREELMAGFICVIAGLMSRWLPGREYIYDANFTEEFGLSFRSQLGAGYNADTPIARFRHFEMPHHHHWL